MDTAEEFAPYEEAHHELLDMFGEGQGVKRLEGELDANYRERIREAVRMRKKLERVAAGESLIPPEVPLAPPSDAVLLGSLPPDPKQTLETMAEWAMLTEHARARDEEVVRLRAELIRLRGALKDIELSAKLGSWAGVNRGLDRARSVE